MVAVIGFASCDKVDELPFYGNGTAPVLSASASTVAPAPADSNNVVLTLSWSYPNHATDSATMKYVVEIDSVSKNFSNPYQATLNGALSTSFIAKELNTVLLNRGYAFNVPVSMEVRVISSYGNNNERLYSNVLPLSITPYKVPPRVALPVTGKLYIVGAATQGGWNNPVPTPTQELARLDETTWGGVFEMNGGSQYLLLPENGSWDNKFSVASNTVPGLDAGGDFGFNLPDNFPGPSASGWYKIIVDFQTGKFKVTAYTAPYPTDLFIVGDATPGGWSNPVPVPSQQLTRLNASQWSIALNFTGSGSYLLLPNNGSWDSKYAVPSGSVTDLWKGGKIEYYTGGGDNIPGPTSAGVKTLLVTLSAKEDDYPVGKFTVTP